MRFLIATASKTNTTRECGEKLKDLLERRGVLVDLVDLGPETPSPAGYNCTILGGYVRMNALPKEELAYVEKYHDLLVGRHDAYFTCGAFIDKTEDVLRANLPADILENCVCAAGFGGSIDKKRLKGFERLMARSMRSLMRKYGMEEPSVKEEIIEAFAEQILQSLDSAAIDKTVK